MHCTSDQIRPNFYWTVQIYTKKFELMQRIQTPLPLELVTTYDDKSDIFNLTASATIFFEEDKFDIFLVKVKCQAT